MNPEEFIQNTIAHANKVVSFPFCLSFGNNMQRFVELRSRIGTCSGYHIEKNDYRWTASQNSVQCTIFFGLYGWRKQRFYQKDQLYQSFECVNNFLILLGKNALCGCSESFNGEDEGLLSHSLNLNS